MIGAQPPTMDKVGEGKFNYLTQKKIELHFTMCHGMQHGVNH